MFASEYPINDAGHIVFPDDVQLRKHTFERVYHPSHNNLYLYDALLDYLVEDGDVVCDPMAGAGSILYALSQRPRVNGYLIELGPYYFDMLVANYIKLKQPYQWVNMREGDCISLLPLTEKMMGQRARLIIFSPPYANQLKISSGLAVYEKEGTKDSAGIGNFTYEHPANLGNMKQFFFNRAMQKVYDACFKATQVGGHLALIIKDRIDKGQRVGYGVQHAKMAFNAGYDRDTEWFQREAVGKVFGAFNLSRGIKQITDEHIIIFKRI